MKKFREVADRRQQALIPRSVEEFVPEDDLVRYVDALVDEFNISKIENWYSSFGRPGFSPRVLIKILLYGKIRGLRSSRELARAVQENLRFIYIASNEKPDFRTISKFRKRFSKELSSLLAQTVGIGMSEGLISLDHVSIDGTKFGASAGRNSFKTPEELEKRILELEKELRESFKQDCKLDEQEDERFGDDDYDGGLPAELQDKKVLRDKMKEALKNYESFSNKPKKVSVTDPESRFMKGKGINPSYNAQAAIDTESRMVVGGYITNATCDHGQLPDVLEDIEQTCGRNPEQISADKGYGLKKGLVELQKRKITGYVSQRKESPLKFSILNFKYIPDKDVYVCPNGRKLELEYEHLKQEYKQYKCTNCDNCQLRKQCTRGIGNRTLKAPYTTELWLDMLSRTESDKGKEIAKIRSSTIEPLFGYIKSSKKLRRFMFRGLNMINCMWKLELAAVNLEKLAKHHRQKKLITA